MLHTEVLFSPAEFEAASRRDLSRTTCVVFDVLRATSSMITALAAGAGRIIPVGEISEALARRAAQPTVLLAGEREGLRIRAPQSGGMDFDLGNSPREFTPQRVRGRTLVMTTTNGTRALRACATAHRTWIGAFLNLGALVDRLRADAPQQLLIVCSGTHEEAAFEDALAAGAVCDALWAGRSHGHMADSAQIARQIYAGAGSDLLGAMKHARNGRRLLQIPELADDVAFCLQRDTTSLLASLENGAVVRAG